MCPFRLHNLHMEETEAQRTLTEGLLCASPVLKSKCEFRHFTTSQQPSAEGLQAQSQ
jgi:hypothetical protein